MIFVLFSNSSKLVEMSGESKKSKKEKKGSKDVDAFPGIKTKNEKLDQIVDLNGIRR